jgi:hypothetical protein
VSAGRDHPKPLADRESKARTALFAAYREGLGLAAVAIVHAANGIRVEALGNDCHGSLPAGEKIGIRWWCRRAPDAVRVAAAATVRLRRSESKDRAPVSAAAPSPQSAQLADTAVAAAAKHCGVTPYSDEETLAAATALVARVDAEIGQLQRTGELKSVNRSYRNYRTETTARGETALPYAKWLNEYKANLVRQLAATLRFS